MPAECTHLNQIKVRTTTTHVCGHVGCCDSSKNKHATKHFHKTKHPLIRSIEPGEAWVWCYVDEIEAGEIDA